MMKKYLNTNLLQYTSAELNVLNFLIIYFNIVNLFGYSVQKYIGNTSITVLIKDTRFL